MPHPKEHMLRIMSFLETKKDHLILRNISTHFAHIPVKERLKLQLGYTNHPAFEKIDQIDLTYQLKTGMSASQALDDLLTTYEMTVDCQVVALLATYLAILQTMKEIHGESLGIARFDAFYGSSTEITPEPNRLLLTPYGPRTGTHHLPGKEKNFPLQSLSPTNFFPFEPLAFVIDLKQAIDKSTMRAQLNIGDSLQFSGAPYYSNIHLRGSASGNVCVVTSLNPVKVRTFGYDEELTEDMLAENHIRAYAEPASEESIAAGSSWLARVIHPTVNRSDILGIETIFHTFNDLRLQCLLYAPIEIVKEAFDKYYEQEKLLIHMRWIAPFEEKLAAAPKGTEFKLRRGFLDDALKKERAYLPSRGPSRETPPPSATEKKETPFGFKPGFLKFP